MTDDQRLLLDWMRQQVLVVSWSGTPGNYDAPEYTEWWQWLHDVMSEVLALAIRSFNGETVRYNHEQLVIAEYMRDKAELQIARYANTITETQFYAACRELRERRDEQLREVVA